VAGRGGALGCQEKQWVASRSIMKCTLAQNPSKNNMKTCFFKWMAQDGPNFDFLGNYVGADMHFESQNKTAPKSFFDYNNIFKNIHF
jgi:hypothetical protein